MTKNNLPTSCSLDLFGFFSKAALLFFISFICVPIALANPPTTPENFRYQVYSSSAAELFWNRSSDDRSVIGYEITQNGISAGVRDALSFYTDSLTRGVTYTFTIAAVDNEDNRSTISSITFVAGNRGEVGSSNPVAPVSPPSSTTPVAPVTPPSTTTPVAPVNPVVGGLPSTPENFRFRVYSSRSAELFWNRSSDDRTVIEYEITQNGVVMGVRDALSYYTSSLTSGDTYTFTIAAVDNDDNRSSISSVTFVAGNRGDSGSAAPVIPPVAPPVAPPVVASLPTVPEDFRYRVYSKRSAEIFWNRSSDDGRVIGYELTQNGVVLGVRDALSFYTSSLTPGDTYTFTVAAVDNDDNRSATSSVTFIAGDRGEPSTAVPTPNPVTPQTPPTAPITPPSGNIAAIPPAPEEALLVVYSSTAAELFWARPDSSFGEVTTSIYRDGILVDETTGASYFDDNRERGVSYQYELFAANANGDSDGSTIVGEEGSTNTPVVEPPSTETPTVEPPFTETPVVEPPPVVDLPPVVSQSSPGISDNLDVFETEGYEQTNVLRVDLRTVTTPGICIEEDQSGCTLDDVIADTDRTDNFKVEILVHFSADDFPIDGTMYNAELRQRGGGSRNGAQKSFRIKIDDKDNLWRSERHLQLNKHPFESTRIRNKISFDLMQDVPNLPSLRTQFVNLWIDDGQGPVDFGLFTHIERPNDRMLTKHGLDPDGVLYKTEFFKFTRDDLVNMQIDAEGEPLDEDTFERALNIEEGKDHRKVVAMVEALNDPNRSFESAFNEYFDFQNVLSWATVNLLLGNRDAIRHNYLLYSPTDSNKFFILPWDYDAAWRVDDEPTNTLDEDSLKDRLLYGYARGEKNVLLAGFYKLPGVHQAILDHATLLRNGPFSDANVADVAARYLDLIEPFEEREPDSIYNPYFSTSTEDFAETLIENELSLRNAFSIPMAPTLEDPILENGEWIFRWTPAFEVTGSTLTYDVQIATSPMFEPASVLYQVEGLADGTGILEQRVSQALISSGERYVRVIARSAVDPQRFWQVSANDIETSAGPEFLGGLAFEVQ